MENRLHIGELVRARDRSAAHGAFFGSIQTCAPEVLKSLWRGVLPSFKEVSTSPAFPFNEHLVFTIYQWAAGFRLVKALGPADKATLASLLDRPNALVSRPDWRFFFQWVFFAAYKTLTAWSQSQRRPRSLRWSLPRWDLPLGDPLDALMRDYETEVQKIALAPSESSRKGQVAHVYLPCLESSQGTTSLGAKPNAEGAQSPA
jgi:hypothetical protein